MLSSYTWGLNEQTTLSERELTGRSQDSSTRRKKQAKTAHYARSLPSQPLYEQANQKCVEAGLLPKFSVNDSKSIDWSTMPLACTPSGGHVPADRCARKTQQVENMLSIALPLARSLLRNNSSKRIVRIVEFCAGSGFIAVPLAYLLLRDRAEHDARFEIVLVDWKGPSMSIAQERIEQAGVADVVKLTPMDISDYDEPFHLGISLHACGSASDVSIEKCIAAKAMMLHCPCCIGKILKFRSFPLSIPFRIVFGTDKKMFGSLFKAGDFGHGTDHVRNTNRMEDERVLTSRRACKRLVELDRLLFIQTAGYTVQLRTMNPPSASAKNDMLIAIPNDARVNWNLFDSSLDYLCIGCN